MAHKLALITLAGVGATAERFYTDAEQIDKEALEQFKHFFNRDVFCNGVTSEPCEEEDEKPVCGSDGWTYKTVCNFKQEYCMGNVQLRFKKWGGCDEETEEAEEKEEVCETKPCSRDFRPVCGSNGQTFSNKCEFENAQRCYSGELSIAYYGPCDEPEYEEEPEEEAEEEKCDPDPACDRMYSPVCGSDGETYSNLCVFGGAVCASGITLKHRGKCMQNDLGKFNPFGGRLPNLPGFDPELERYWRPLFEEDVEEEEEVEEETCDNIDCSGERKRPVCGELRDIARVYHNECTMKSMSCQIFGDLYTIEKVGTPKKGKCKTKYQQKFGNKPRFAPPSRFHFGGRFGRDAEEYDCSQPRPWACSRRAEGMRGLGVCGSDGVTYGNYCALALAGCESGVTLAYNDRCDNPCAADPTKVDLQCATNGLTYWNKCAVDEFNFMLGNTNLVVEIAYAGPCMETPPLPRWMADDFISAPRQENEEDEEEESPEDPYSKANCARRQAVKCSQFDHKACYNDGKTYSMCEFRRAKCDNKDLVLAINPNSCY